MKEWLLFILFILVGVGMLGTGLVYKRKERHDAESIKIYNTTICLGAALSIFAVLMKFVY